MVSRGSKVWKFATCWLGTPREPALSVKWERLAKPLAVDLTASGEYTLPRWNLRRPLFPRPENIKSEGHHPSSNRQSWHAHQAVFLNPPPKILLAWIAIIHLPLLSGWVYHNRSWSNTAKIWFADATQHPILVSPCFRFVFDDVSSIPISAADFVVRRS